MSRTIAISDIHGCIEPFTLLLERLQLPNKQDQLILLGDYCDRGHHSKEVIEKVMELVHHHHVIALKGNHDQRLADLILRDDAEVKAKFLQHGGLQTIESYMGNEADNLERFIEYMKVNYSDHIRFLNELPLYYEDEQHIYVHAGINPDYKDWKQQSPYDFMYIKDRFINATFDLGKKVVFGHTKTIDICGSPDIWFSQDKIGIDGGCAYGLQLNALLYHHTTAQYAAEFVSNDSKQKI